MTPLMVALLSGFLRAHMVAQLQFGCIAVHPDPDQKDAVRLHCVLLDDQGHVLREVQSQTIRVPEKGMANDDLATLYCGAAQSVLTFTGAPG